jgi:hypothetical protein
MKQNLLCRRISRRLRRKGNAPPSEACSVTISAQFKCHCFLMLGIEMRAKTGSNIQPG